MAVTLTIDAKGLGTLQRRIAGLRGAGVRRRLAKVVAHEALAQVLGCFEASRDPYGTPWPPLRVRQGQPLLGFGRLRNSLHEYASGTQAGVTTDVKYAAVHQGGATIRPVTRKALRFRGPQGWVFTRGPVVVPARPFFPARGMPASWTAAIHEVAAGFLRQLAQAGVP